MPKHKQCKKVHRHWKILCLNLQDWWFNNLFYKIFYLLYLLQCNCGLQYVGRAKGALLVWIREHLVNIRKGFCKHIFSKHFTKKHNKAPSCLKVIGIKVFSPHWRGSNVVWEFPGKKLLGFKSSKPIVLRGSILNGTSIVLLVTASLFLFWLWLSH